MQYKKNQHGTIFGTGEGSVKDGPGIRYVIYFKGCNFKCPWCSNPEGMNKKEELLLYPEKEQFTNRIVESCLYNAVGLDSKGATKTNRKICEKCKTFDCVDVCYDDSRIKVGEIKKVNEIISDVLRYKDFFKKNGGVTLTGGEPTYQWDFMCELIRGLKYFKIHTAVETNGAHPNLSKIFSYIDLIIFDLKIMDTEKHKVWTGYSNRQILKNIKKLYRIKKRFWIRIPVIPGINDSEGNLRKTIEFLSPMKDFIKVELLAYHKTGVIKWKALGKKYLLPNIKPPTKKDMNKYKKLFSDAGITVINT